MTKTKKLLTSLFGDTGFAAAVTVPFSVMLLEEDGLWRGATGGTLVWNPDFGVEVTDDKGEKTSFPFEEICGVGYEVESDTVSFACGSADAVQINISDVLEGLVDCEVQVNGVFCDTIRISKDSPKSLIERSAMTSEGALCLIGDDRSEVGFDIIPNKLVNILTK